MPVNPRAASEEFQYLKGVVAAAVDLRSGKGLEVGPFDRPFFVKDEADVEYLDYRSAVDLRAMAARAPGHSPDFVVEPDYVVPGSGDWGGVPDGRFDWVLSSHALEHSPNLIGFLNVMGSKLRPGGLLISILPDKRATFDVHRPPTSLGRIVEDFLLDARSPRAQSVFDSTFYQRSVSIADAEGRSRLSLDLLVDKDNFQSALQEAKKACETYYDTHNYVFTSEIFHQQILHLCAAGLVPGACVMHLPTRPGHMSFLNALRKSG